MPYPAVDLSKVRTYPIRRRENLVALENLVFPSQSPPAFDHPDLVELADRMVTARRQGHQVIFMLGGHVVKCGLAPILIELMRLGIITHLASNGSAAIHDFEISLNGSTSEDVAASLADGSFGMAEETGAWMNQAVQQGVLDGMGMGEALGRMIAEDEDFQFREHSLLFQAYTLGIPYTVHVAIGTDIIHQHPLCDFSAIGAGSGQDFKVLVHSVTKMVGGVFCNFGSSVIGPEVFLKSLSIARNLGNPLRNITTANFDLVPLTGDYRKPASKENPEYYYRPKKNIVIRPNLLGGRGYHINGDHRQTIPNLYHLVKNQMGEVNNLFQEAGTRKGEVGTSSFEVGSRIDLVSQSFLAEWRIRHPELEQSIPAIQKAIRMLVDCFRAGGTLYLCGNGGSFADALHIAAELNKSFKHPRPLPAALRERMRQLPDGEALAGMLQQGLRSVVLGTNPSLLSAIDNDSPHRHLYFAQELISLARPGEVILGISTSGMAENIRLAVVAAKARGVKSIVLTGSAGNPLQMADVVISSPGQDTAAIQEWHIRIYHVICEILERALFKDNGEI